MTREDERELMDAIDQIAEAVHELVAVTGVMNMVGGEEWHQRISSRLEGAQAAVRRLGRE